jgi:hypothetical protein
LIERLSVQDKVGDQLLLAIHQSIAQGTEQCLA